MPKFLFVYHGGMTPENPQEIEKVMGAWTAWFQGMGDAVVDGGSPVGKSMTVSASGITADGGANPVSGYSVIRATDMAAATAHAQRCPMLADGGTVDVAEIRQI